MKSKPSDDATRDEWKAHIREVLTGDEDYWADEAEAKRQQQRNVQIEQMLRDHGVTAAPGHQLDLLAAMVAAYEAGRKG